MGVAKKRNVDLSASRSRSVRSADPNTADLVIGMTLDHVASAVVDGGADAQKSFTLTELVRLLEDGEARTIGSEAEAVEVVADLHSKRNRSNSFAPAADIEDPMGGPPTAYEKMADKVDDLCIRLARAMGWRGN